MSRHKRVHRAWLQVAQELLPGWLNQDSCIASTAIGLDALAHFGVKAKPVPYLLMVFNAAYIRRATREGRHSSSPAETGAWWEEERAWALGLGAPDTPRGDGKWPGHLAIWSHSWLLDVTAGQASRPERRMFVPQVLRLQVGAFQLPQSHGAQVGGNAPVGLELLPRWEDQSFREAPDWAANRPMFHRDILPDVLERMRKLL